MFPEGILKDLEALVSPFQQSHLLQHISTWPPQDLHALKQTLKKLPVGLIGEQSDVLSRLRSRCAQDIGPYVEYIAASSYEHQATGKQLIEEGKVACVILAGGQGTRLGWNGPKALFPIFPETTLLHMHVHNAGSMPIAIMCSPSNGLAIQAALEKWRDGSITAHGPPEIFLQDLIPFMTQQEHWFLEEKGILSEGPDGNGKVFHYLARAGILQRWQNQGIEHIVVVPIDNPLALPLDPKLIDYHHNQGVDVTGVCIVREDPHEQVGVFAKCHGKPCIVEYSEIMHDQRVARNRDGSLLFQLANTGIFVFRLEFAALLVEKPFSLHAAAKPAGLFHPKTGTIEKIMAWKFETFLFDALLQARKMAALLYPRHQIYAPLKNAEGEKSPATVRAAIAKRR